MNDLEYRFGEIYASVAMLEGAEDLEPDSFLFPNYTDGLENMALVNALAAQSARESDEWRLALYTCLINTTLSGIEHREGKVGKADLNALALAINIAWLSQEGTAIFKAGGILDHLIEHCEGAQYPDFAFTVLDSPKVASEWSKTLDPYALLRGETPSLPDFSPQEGRE